MANNVTPIFAAAPIVGRANLTATTACATRAPIPTASIASNNLVSLVAASATQSQRVDWVNVYAASSSMTSATTAGLVGLWLWDGTNAYLIQELVISAITPSTTSAGFQLIQYFSSPIMIPATYVLYCSTSVTTTASTNALAVQAFGGTY